VHSGNVIEFKFLYKEKAPEGAFWWSFIILFCALAKPALEVRACPYHPTPTNPAGLGMAQPNGWREDLYT